MSQVSLGRPEFVSGTPSGHPTAKFLYVILIIGFFLSIFWTNCQLLAPNSGFIQANAILGANKWTFGGASREHI